MTCFLVEWYRPELDKGQLGAIVADLDRSLVTVSDEGASVRCMLTLAVPADDVVFGVFAADSADAVALVCTRAGMPAARLTAALADRAGGPGSPIAAPGG